MKHFSTLFLCASPFLLSSQSLVLNPGFEDSLQCPSGSGAFVNYVADWTKPSYGSADYFYSGCPIAPNDEPPHSGNAYGGIIVYDPANIREYMTGHLSAPLVAGTTYYVSLYVCLHSSSMEAINEIGAYFTSTNISNANALPIILTPQIEGTSPYTSQNGWQLVSGSFVATGGEQYMIIGSFVADSAMTFTNVQQTGWGDVYYYVDDVCVTTDMNGCALAADNLQKNNDAVSAYPNPATENIRLSFANETQENFTLSVFDSRGQLVLTQTNITTTFADVARNELADGLYFYRLQSAERMINGKFVFE
ncbi:MAG TPA: T9SS type A sorting domain-containing protein [Bacteroidia bacterium]|nr:T9SS type A sorting domain-containing protein [Bacteroidia bacterium]